MMLFEFVLLGYFQW